jgi:uncharacterized protein YkwD
MKMLAAVLTALVLAGSAGASSFIHGSEITPETVLAQMNFYRGLNGAAPLRLDERLALAAADRIRDMEEQQYWSHFSPRGASPFMWLTLRGYSFATAAENLASGFETAEVLVSSWMESAGHRRNIISPDFRDVGIAIIEGATNRRANGCSVVVLFARARGSQSQ